MSIKSIKWLSIYWYYETETLTGSHSASEQCHCRRSLVTSFSYSTKLSKFNISKTHLWQIGCNYCRRMLRRDLIFFTFYQFELFVHMPHAWQSTRQESFIWHSEKQKRKRKTTRIVSYTWIDNISDWNELNFREAERLTQYRHQWKELVGGSVKVYRRRNEDWYT